MNILEIDWPDGFVPAQQGLEADAKRYSMGGCMIMLGTLPNGLIHLSISHPTRNPTWNEIFGARYGLIADDKDMAMYLPSKDEYVNLHKHYFHLHECVCYRGGDLLDLNRK